jgi:hypothetical protein
MTDNHADDELIRRAATNRGLNLDTTRLGQTGPFLQALKVHGTNEDAARAIKLLAALDTETDREVLRQLITRGLREQHPDATAQELDDAARALLVHLRGAGISR